eukprot:5540422-Prymnesium_polylepis.1
MAAPSPPWRRGLPSDPSTLHESRSSENLTWTVDVSGALSPDGLERRPAALSRTGPSMIPGNANERAAIHTASVGALCEQAV